MKVNYYSITFLFVLFIVCKEDSHQKYTDIYQQNSLKPFNEIYYSIASSLNIRNEPSLNSKVIGSVKECEKVELIEDTRITANVKGVNASFYKVKTEKNIIGYVYSSYLNKYEFKNTKPNKSKFKIYGEWWMYYDAPNYSFIFNKDGSAYEETIDFDGNNPPKISRSRLGEFVYDDCCRIIITMDSGKKLEFSIIKLDDKPTLKLKCFIFDPDLFKPFKD